MKLTLNPDALAVESFSMSAGVETNDGAGGPQAFLVAMPTTVNSAPCTACCVNTI